MRAVFSLYLHAQAYAGALDGKGIVLKLDKQIANERQAPVVRCLACINRGYGPERHIKRIVGGKKRIVANAQGAGHHVKLHVFDLHPESFAQTSRRNAAVLRSV